jgi:hypothetical protein
MLVLLRSMFWLSIVFALISWPSDPIEHVQKKSLDFFDHGASRGGKACLRAPAARLRGLPI